MDQIWEASLSLYILKIVFLNIIYCKGPYHTSNAHVHQHLKYTWLNKAFDPCLSSCPEIYLHVSTNCTCSFVSFGFCATVLSVTGIAIGLFTDLWTQFKFSWLCKVSSFPALYHTLIFTFLLQSIFNLFLQHHNEKNLRCILWNNVSDFQVDLVERYVCIIGKWIYCPWAV